MHNPQPEHYSYLLRIWKVSETEENIWRASLKCALTEQHFGFASLADLNEFLCRLTETEAVNPESNRPLRICRKGAKKR